MQPFFRLIWVSLLTDQLRDLVGKGENWALCTAQTKVGLEIRAWDHATPWWNLLCLFPSELPKPVSCALIR